MSKQEERIIQYLRDKWHRTWEEETPYFEVTRESLRGYVVKEFEEYDSTFNRYDTIIHRYSISLSPQETEELYAMVREMFRPGAAETSILDEMKAMAMRALAKKPFGPERRERSFNKIFYLLLLIVLLIALTKNIDISKIQSSRKETTPSDEVFYLISSDMTSEEMEKSIAMLEEMGQQEAFSCMERELSVFTIKSTRGLKPDKRYDENHPLHGLPEGATINARYLEAPMKVILVLEEKGFFTREQFLSLANTFFTRYLMGENGFGEEGTQIFLEAAGRLTDEELRVLFSQSHLIGRLPKSMPSGVIFRIAPEEVLYGTWVLYAGGQVAPEVLIFQEDGKGRAFDLPVDYEEVWLDGQPIPPQYLQEAREFTWQLQEEGKMELFFSSSFPQEYIITFEENMDGTGLPGFSLQLEDGSGGGWVKASE